MVRVAVDAMGGDRAPEEIVAGALEARADGIQPILFGPRGLETRVSLQIYCEHDDVKRLADAVNRLP